MIIKYISLQRLWNLWLLFYTYLLLLLINKSFIKGKPFALSIETSALCNLSCPECPTGMKKLSRKKGLMDKNMFKDIINQVYKETFYVNLYFQGEPFLNKELSDFIKIAKDKKIFTLLSTNGHYLSHENCNSIISSGLNEIIISLDGTSQEVYNSYRIGGDYNKVIEGIENLMECKKHLNASNPRITIQFLLLESNVHQLNDIKTYCKKRNLKLSLKTAQFYNLSKTNPLIPKNKNYSRYKTSHDGSYIIKTKPINRCWRMWSSSVITNDGEVVPCCYDKDAINNFGNISESLFNEIWNMDSYQSFRKKVVKDRKTIDICSNCSEYL